MKHKKELINIAGQLKSLADQLLDCAKEENMDDKETDSENESESAMTKDSKNHAMIGLMLKKKMGK